MSDQSLILRLSRLKGANRYALRGVPLGVDLEGAPFGRVLP